jgi:LiaF transmembrane domain
MNRYILIHRLRGPAILLLIGVLALLDQAGVINHFWHLFWPLLLITVGVLLLAERAALAGDDAYPPPPYPGSPYPGPPYQNPPYPGAADPNAQPGSAIVPSNPHDFGSGSTGGQS